MDKIKDVVSQMCKRYGVKNAYLFGSYAKGKENEGSDVDILLSEGSISTFDDYYDMHEFLEQELGTSVDLLTMDGINPRFYQLIEKDRKILYAA